MSIMETEAPIGITDMRLWIEDMEAPDGDPCQMEWKNGTCPMEAVARVFFTCRCAWDFCIEHRDRILRGPEKAGADGTFFVATWWCPDCNCAVKFEKWEPIR